MKSKIGYLAIILIVALFAFAAGKINHTKNKTSDEVNPAYKDAGLSYPLNKAIIEMSRFTDKYQGEIEAHLFKKELIQKILDQPGCYGIRIFNSVNDKGERDIIIVGTDDKLNNITKLPNGDLGIIGALPGPCPPPPPGCKDCRCE